MFQPKNLSQKLILGGLTPQTLPQLRLSTAVRMYLCAALDSGDWTRLAAGLRLSGHIVSWLEVIISLTSFRPRP